MSFDKHQKIAEEIFSKAHIILPISKYLESIVLAKYPKKILDYITQMVEILVSGSAKKAWN